jgi:hypothetical protein
MLYIPKTTIENYMLVTIEVTADVFIESVITACQNHIENLCGDDVFGKRKFIAEEDDEARTRYFNGNGQKRLPVGDLKEVTSVVVDGISLVLNEDYFLYPLNAVDEGRPYSHIELVQPITNFANQNPRSGNSPYIFEEVQRNVEIVGKWRYSDTPPDEIKLAVTKMVAGVIRENLTDPTTKVVSSESLGEYSVTYSKMSEILNQVGATDLISPYMRKNSGQKIMSGVIQVS